MLANARSSRWPKKPLSRVVFLDVDGVLNSAAEMSAGPDYIPVGTGGLWLERNLLQRLRDLLHIGQAFIVISSSWRREWEAVEALKDSCADAGIARWRFLGQTAEMKAAARTAAGRRVAEISHWLTARRCELGVQQWVALDDLDLASQCPEHLKRNMIRTSPYHGLQLSQVLGCRAPLLTVPEKCKGKGIVLDIDGTLIDSMPWPCDSVPHQPAHIVEGHTAIFPRPHLDKFLDFCFERFTGVGLWTTSDADWCSLIVNQVLGPDRNWCFLWSQQHCSEHMRDKDGNEISLCKKLRKLWKSNTRRACGFDRCSSIIVEDTNQNCYFNKGNAIIVPSFEADKLGDTVLSSLISYLQTEVLSREDVRFAAGYVPSSLPADFDGKHSIDS